MFSLYPLIFCPAAAPATAPVNRARRAAGPGRTKQTAKKSTGGTAPKSALQLIHDEGMLLINVHDVAEISASGHGFGSAMDVDQEDIPVRTTRSTASSASMAQPAESDDVSVAL